MTERLVQQIRAIKDELGDNDDDEDDIVALERKMQSVGMPANVWKHAQRERLVCNLKKICSSFSPLEDC